MTASNKPYTYKRHTARCNKRSCQARRNLTKHPALYRKWPTCHVAGCDGKMYVDWYRMRKGSKDHAPVCRNSACGFQAINEIDLPVHRINQPGCCQYESYMLKRDPNWVPF